MEMMTNGKLKELLSSYPDESNIKLCMSSEGYGDIDKVIIEYILEDDCEIPCIILESDV